MFSYTLIIKLSCEYIVLLHIYCHYSSQVVPMYVYVFVERANTAGETLVSTKYLQANTS